MDSAIIVETLKEILHSDEAPRKIVQLTERLWRQSSASIPLKPNLEPARVHICCVLAIEERAQQASLPAPDTRRPPIPPAAYSKLLAQFRQTLLGKTSGPGTRVQPARPLDTEPPQTAPSSAAGGEVTASGSGKRRPMRTARQRSKIQAGRITASAAATGLDESVPTADFDGNSPESDPELDDSYGENDSDGSATPTVGTHASRTGASPRKRTARASGQGVPRHDGSLHEDFRPSPRKRTKSTAPTPALVEKLGGHMELAEQTTSAVRHAFEQYVELVKDPWGLVYGLFAVISERAEPRQGSENIRRLDHALRELGPPRLYIDPNEWVPWAERIVTGQTWIMNISQRPEPVPPLVCGPGGWGLGIEYTLVDQ